MKVKPGPRQPTSGFLSWLQFWNVELEVRGKKLHAKGPKRVLTPKVKARITREAREIAKLLGAKGGGAARARSGIARRSPRARGGRPARSRADLPDDFGLDDLEGLEDLPAPERRSRPRTRSRGRAPSRHQLEESVRECQDLRAHVRALQVAFRAQHRRKAAAGRLQHAAEVGVSRHRRDLLLRASRRVLRDAVDRGGGRQLATREHEVALALDWLLGNDGPNRTAGWGWQGELDWATKNRIGATETYLRNNWRSVEAVADELAGAGGHPGTGFPVPGPVSLHPKDRKLDPRNKDTLP